MIPNPFQEAVRAKLNRSSSDPWRDLETFGNLTPLQYQFWIGQKLHPDMPLFNVVESFTIMGSINPDRFQAAFQTLIDRTDALRTVFEEIEGIPRQRVVDELPYTVEYLDFSEEPAPRASFQAWMRDRSKILLDLEKRLFDSALAKISANQFTWYLCFHHIITDGWSLYVIFQRMQELYRRSLEGRLDEPITFPAFRHYVESERAYRLSPRYLADQAYWEKKLVETPRLAFYGHQPARQPAPLRRVERELGPERTQKLKALARQERFAGKTLNIALFNMLAGVLAAYLYRITGSKTLSIGTPFSNRPSPVLKETVGLLMQIAPLRIMVAEGDTFASLIQRIQAESAQTARHCRYPLGDQQNSLYDAIFNFPAVSFTTFQGMPVRDNVLRSGVDGYSFSLHMRYPQAESILLQFDFHPEVFDEAQQKRSVEHFLHALDAFLLNPDQPIGRFSLLSKSEKQRLLLEWNQTGVSFSEDLRLHRLFEEQVKRTPDAVALVFPSTGSGHGDDRQLTYSELNLRANRLAYHLRSLGVGPDALVGICVGRSVEMVVGLLGVLKAGGAYVPLDPDYPKKRLAFMLEDAQPKVLLTQSKVLSRLPEMADDRRPRTEDRKPPCAMRCATVICLDRDWETIARESDENPTCATTPENLAYVIYTSGSTGKPKGVQIPHRAVANFLTSTRREPGLTDQDTLLAVTTLSFDIAALEIFLPLVTGARAVIVSREAAADGALLSKELTRCGATTMQATPATWRMLVETGWKGSNGLKVLCGGEALPGPLAAQLLARGSSLWNLYGPTETTVWSAVCQLDKRGGPAPIGRPIANTQIYLLNRHLQPVPIGVSGELYIGGAGLGRGYLNRPELTADRFIPNPFSSEPGARLYKTGDLARYLPDDNIEFLGRIDHQVKIRGFRVELGEIESALSRHPAVRETVVVDREDTPDDKRLIAYVVPDRDSSPSATELRGFLKERLPDYMLPSVVVFLEALPLTPNGKVDRRALPAPDSSRPDPSGCLAAPRNSVEAVLVGIWSEVLKLERVDIYDNFFALGGHSLHVLRIVSRIRDAFNVNIPLRTLFELPTVAGLAVEITQAQTKSFTKQMADVVADVKSLPDEEAERLVGQDHRKNV